MLYYKFQWLTVWLPITHYIKLWSCLYDIDIDSSDDIDSSTSDYSNSSDYSSDLSALWVPHGGHLLPLQTYIYVYPDVYIKAPPCIYKK